MGTGTNNDETFSITQRFVIPSISLPPFHQHSTVGGGGCNVVKVFLQIPHPAYLGLQNFNFKLV